METLNYSKLIYTQHQDALSVGHYSTKTELLGRNNKNEKAVRCDTQLMKLHMKSHGQEHPKIFR